MFKLCIRMATSKPLLVTAILLVLIVTSFVTIPKLNLDAFPDVTNVQVVINTEAPGLAAEEVEQLITFPVESVMYSLPSVEEVRSISKTGLSIITVVFKEGTDIYFARQLAFEKLQSAKELIPGGVGNPVLGPDTSGLGQIYQYLLVAEPNSDFDTMALRSLNDWVVKILLMPVDGVTDVLSFGGEVKQYQVNLDPSRLLALGLTIEDIVTALEDNNQNAGGWYVNRGQEQLVIRGVGWLSSEKLGIEEIKQIPVKITNGAVVTLSDVANVNYGSEIRQGAVSMTQRNAEGDATALGEVVTGIVLKRMGANTKQTIDGINQRVELINQALPEGVRFEAFYDQADLISKAIETVSDALIFAFVIIIVVLALFLMNLRATLLVVLSVPISIAMALMMMSILDISANLMSLGGMAVAIGMLVDSSVVMVENIIRRLSYKEELNSTKELIQTACLQVARPVFFATSIILVVFLPLYSFEGVEAKLFQPMATSIILAVISALIVALVFVPALAVILFRKGTRVSESKWTLSIQSFYKTQLQKALTKPGWVLSSSLLLFVIALWLLSRIGTEFVPELEEGTLNIRVTLAPTSSLETAIDVAPKLEAILMEFPEVNYALSRVGRAEIGGDPEPVSNIEIYLGMKPVSEWTSASNRYELQKKMQQKLSSYPGLLFNFSQPIATRVDELLSGVKAQLAIKLFGPDLDLLARNGKAIEQLVKSVPGTRDVALEAISGEAQLTVRPDRRQLSRFGLSVKDLMELIKVGLGGEAVGQIIKGNERYDVYVRYAKNFRDSAEKIANLRLLTPSGAWVLVDDVADIKIETGPPQIRRDDVQRRVVVQANVDGRDMGSVVADIKYRIDQNLKLPTGYSVEIGGQFKNQQRAQQRLMIVVPIVLMLIALLLYFAFNSIAQATLILVNIPLATIGGIISLYVSDLYLSVPSSIGFITLFGIAVLNGVVMVESINQRRDATADMQEAIIEGAVSRLRPVLMTAITSASGLIPILLSSGIGSEIQRPLAAVIVGGIVTSTLLTLLVLPVLYRKFSKAR
ncbi:efflux RND transporter permease subunit [Pleionea sp. CnH1-48]|uniref:efflux RND transporter permease subunit n=1 Tax=Pleionea sp. CnH1-48 TaxID=2954494 RepID=UPI0020981E86|nr:CusA/CzcA family heavy metal efflux RND transporter [Pleionea sp. CnH1-48]MCO7225237.1 CusA/CzcA family heavy metal efflux RND transporter [Pleionea sp. CnH1-48]